LCSTNGGAQPYRIAATPQGACPQRWQLAGCKLAAASCLPQVASCLFAAASSKAVIPRADYKTAQSWRTNFTLTLLANTRASDLSRL